MELKTTPLWSGEWGEEKSGPPVFSMSAPWTLDDDTEAVWLVWPWGVKVELVFAETHPEERRVRVSTSGFASEPCHVLAVGVMVSVGTCCPPRRFGRWWWSLHHTIE